MTAIRIFACALLAASIASPAWAGFVMGSSGSAKGPRGYSSAPRVESVTPEYEAIDTQTIEAPAPAAPTPLVESAPIEQPPPAPEPQQVEHMPAYPPANAEPVQAFSPPPIEAPRHSTEMPSENETLKLKRISNLPISKPETRVEPIDATPDNMPYNSGYDVMKPPLEETAPPTWRDSEGSRRPVDQGKSRRISNEIQTEGVVINPYPERPAPIASQAPAQAVPAHVLRAPANAAPVPAAPAAAPAPAPQQFSQAVGFASDIPLALALSQVVPPEYAYSFDPGVNPGYRVSWNGGKPWNVVVEEMLAPLNLRADIGGGMVVVRPASAPAPQQQSMAAPTAPAPVPAAPRPEVAETQSVGTAASGQPVDLAALQPKAYDAPARVTDPGEQPGIQPQQQKSAPSMDEQAQAAVSVDQQQSESQLRIWEAKQGDSLKQTLSDWSAQANVRLDWEAGQDYPLSSNVFINGTYSNAVKILFTHGFDQGQAPAHRFTGDNGQTVLTVQDRA